MLCWISISLKVFCLMPGTQAIGLGQSRHEALASATLAHHRLLVALIVLEGTVLSLWLTRGRTSAHNLVH